MAYHCTFSISNLMVSEHNFDPRSSYYFLSCVNLDRSVALAPKLDTTATSIDAAASTRIEITASPRIKTVAPEVATTSFDLCGYYFAVTRDRHRSF